MNAGPAHPVDRECPFCGSRDSVRNLWSFEEGEREAVECNQCAAAAPLSVWNGSRECDGLPASVQEALNSGDGSYRP